MFFCPLSCSGEVKFISLSPCGDRSWTSKLFLFTYILVVFLLAHLGMTFYIPNTLKASGLQILNFRSTTKLSQFLLRGTVSFAHSCAWFENCERGWIISSSPCGDRSWKNYFVHFQLGCFSLFIQKLYSKH